MISSIFGKTKPINYIIVLTFLFFFFWLVHFFLFDRAYSLEQLVFQTLVLGLLFFSFFIVNFIVKRNKITGSNSFAILFYVLLLVVFPETLLDSNTILCSFFLLLATRRLISIRSLKNIKFKIFDATFWIMVSSLFYDWALLYLVLVFVAVYMYEPKNIRNWMVPFAGIFTVAMIAQCLAILANQNDFLTAHYQFSFEINVDYFLDWGNSTKLITYILVTFFAGLLAFLKLGKTGMGKVFTMRLIALSFVIGLALHILKSSEYMHPILVTFFPSVVFLTKYVESIRRPNIKEIVLIASVIAPFLVLLISIAIQ